METVGLVVLASQYMSQNQRYRCKSNWKSLDRALMSSKARPRKNEVGCQWVKRLSHDRVVYRLCIR